MAETEAQKRKQGLRLAECVAKKHEETGESRVGAFVFAREHGASLREIAEVTGIDHATVKRIIDRTTTR